MKKFLSTLIFVLAAGMIFAQSTEELKEALKAKDVEAVKTILESSDEENSKELEAEIISKVKKAVSEDDLDYASDLANVVLLYDFDNLEAQKLYTSIEKAKKNKAEKLARQQEEERKKKEEEEKRLKAEAEKKQMEEYYARKEKEEKEAAKAKDDYIEQVSKIGWKNFPINFALTPAAFDISKSSFADDYNNSKSTNVRYGFGANADAGFNHPYVIVNLHLDYDFYPIVLSGDGMKSDFLGRISVGLPSFSDTFRVALGYKAMNIFSEKDIALYDKIATPTIGIGVENIKFGENFKMGCFLDFDFITLDKMSTIDFAFGTDFNFKYYIPFSISMFKFYVENDSKFDVIRVSNQTEWSINTKFCFGASING